MMSLSAQRSHILLVQTNPVDGLERDFLDWYLTSFHHNVLEAANVLSVAHYERHSIDITRGRYKRPLYRYLAIHQLLLDGAEAAKELIADIAALHDREPSAQSAATWLYYPTCERLGQSPASTSMLTVAFANGIPGNDQDFCEFYSTRHIRHALQIAALASGQCFMRTQFQAPGAMEAAYQIIALYEQTGTPESIIESFASLPREALAFPLLDRTRFAESVYTRLL